MSKFIALLIILALGAGLWFYFLIDEPTPPAEERTEGENEIEEEPSDTPVIRVEEKATFEVPENSDAGMEFPTLDTDS